MEDRRMDRNELIKLVERIQSVTDSEEEIDNMIDVFLKNVSDPRALEYLHGKEYEDWTPEQIVDKVLNYKPFYL